MKPRASNGKIWNEKNNLLVFDGYSLCAAASAGSSRRIGRTEKNL
jgi:hypothetical protein